MVVHSLTSLIWYFGFGKKIVRWHPPIITRRHCARSMSCSHTQMDDDKGVDQWRESAIPIIVYDVNVPGHVRDLVDSWLRSADHPVVSL
jgi:hypothetical protein